jgi:hypothetical protein
MGLWSPDRNLKTAATDFKEATKGPHPSTSEASARSTECCCALALQAHRITAGAEPSGAFQLSGICRLLLTGRGSISPAGGPQQANAGAFWRGCTGSLGAEGVRWSVGCIGCRGRRPASCSYLPASKADPHLWVGVIEDGPQRSCRIRWLHRSMTELTDAALFFS